MEIMAGKEYDFLSKKLMKMTSKINIFNLNNIQNCILNVKFKVLKYDFK